MEKGQLDKLKNDEGECCVHSVKVCLCLLLCDSFLSVVVFFLDNGLVLGVRDIDKKYQLDITIIRGYCAGIYHRQLTHKVFNILHNL